MSDDALLSVEGLQMVFENKYRSFAAVDDLSFSVQRGQTLGIVGESGSGKTMALHSVMRLLPNQARISKGKVIYKGQDLLGLPEKICEKSVAVR